MHFYMSTCMFPVDYIDTFIYQPKASTKLCRQPHLQADQASNYCMQERTQHADFVIVDSIPVLARINRRNLSHRLCFQKTSAKVSPMLAFTGIRSKRKTTSFGSVLCFFSSSPSSFRHQLQITSFSFSSSFSFLNCLRLRTVRGSPSTNPPLNVSACQSVEGLIQLRLCFKAKGPS